MKKIQSYKKLLKMLNDFHDSGILASEIDNRCAVEAAILTESLREKFKINFPTIHNTWCKVDEYSSLALYGTAYNRKISWSDDNRQPEDEWLYCISFPCGAYTFNRDHYPVATFNDFFNALKDLNPKYCDTHNHAVYFYCHNAAESMLKYKELFDHYLAQVKIELDARRLEKLKKELAELEGNQTV